MNEKKELENKLKKVREKIEEVNDRLNAALKQKALKDKGKEIPQKENAEEKIIVEEKENAQI